MLSVKQLFLILSIISVASAAKKGVSARRPVVDAETHRGLKKESKSSSSKKGASGGFVAPNRGGGIVGGGPVGVGGINRDGTTPGQLIQPPNKACVPFDEARKWLTADYPGDAQCRDAGTPMGTTSACCRVFTFTDTNGPQKWLLYDVNNQYRDLMCVCNANTGAGTTNTPVIPGIPGTGTNPDRDGGVGGGALPPVNYVPGNQGYLPGSPGAAPPTPANPPATSPTPATPPTTPTPVVGGPQGVCDNPNPTQLGLQDSPYMVACKDSSPCGDNKCCFSNYCVCWPVSQLVPGTSYCL